MPLRKVKYSILILSTLVFSSALSQKLNYTLSKCKKVNLKPKKSKIDSLTVYILPSDSLELFTKSTEAIIDSVYFGISGSDTINRLDQNYRDDFIEVFPYFGIEDSELILRIMEMYPRADQLEKELRKLGSNFQYVAPHLFNNFGSKYAIIPYQRGYNFIDKSGNIVFDCEFQNLSNFIDGYAFVKIEGIWLKMDGEGNLFKF
ncbi:MAG: WG repeat-containing protein [Crocinitomicaceae bacterium]